MAQSQTWAAWDTDHWASRFDALGNLPVFTQDDNGGGGNDAARAWETAAAKGRPPAVDRHRRQRRDGPESHDATVLFRRCGGAWRAPRRLARRDGRPPPRVGWAWNKRSAPAPGPGRRRKSRMSLIARRSRWYVLIGVGVGILDIPPTMLLAFFSAGGGHGNYLWAKGNQGRFPISGRPAGDVAFVARLEALAGRVLAASSVGRPRIGKRP